MQIEQHVEHVQGQPTDAEDESDRDEQPVGAPHAFVLLPSRLLARRARVPVVQLAADARVRDADGRDGQQVLHHQREERVERAAVLQGPLLDAERHRGDVVQVDRVHLQRAPDEERRRQQQRRQPDEEEDADGAHHLQRGTCWVDNHVIPGEITSESKFKLQLSLINVKQNLKNAFNFKNYITFLL